MDPGRNKLEPREGGKRVVAGKVEKPWMHPAVWRMSVPRCDPVPSMVIRHQETGRACG